MRNISLTTSLFALSLSLITSAAWASPGQGSGDNGLTEADVDRTISLEAGDMWFDPEELELAAGEVVKFEITNTGNLEHEFVIGSKEAQEEHRQMMLNMANGGGHDMSNAQRLPVTLVAMRHDAKAGVVAETYRTELAVQELRLLGRGIDAYLGGLQHVSAHCYNSQRLRTITRNVK